jgi:hypothetical protein
LATPVKSDIDDIAAFAFAFAALILIAIPAFMASAWCVMVAWNWSMPYLFALPEASYRSACGLTLLAWAVRVSSIRISKE